MSCIRYGTFALLRAPDDQTNESWIPYNMNKRISGLRTSTSPVARTSAHHFISFFSPSRILLTLWFRGEDRQACSAFSPAVCDVSGQAMDEDRQKHAGSRDIDQ